MAMPREEDVTDVTDVSGRQGSDRRDADNQPEVSEDEGIRAGRSDRGS